MTLDDVLELLAGKVQRAGGKEAWAKQIGTTRQMVSSVLAKSRPPSERMLTALGLERVARTVVTYRQIKRTRKERSDG